jgi:trehalose-6-phosphate synthase
MPAEERRGRMNRMRAAVSENNIYRWAGQIVQTLCGLEDGDSWTKGAVPMQQFSGISVA